ncbi:MAG: adenylosuccinate lyase [Lentisphaerae bacterium RIFOXYA12_FULL_48_11]|nr:MAG: adenylosuccinate lyase [Lentisphaerae bacterium RIFOXYA12_FULL_48_11]
MIPRYTGKEIGTIWTDENKFRTWLRIEILACEAMNKLGMVPTADLKRIQTRSNFNVKRIDRIEAKVNHDVIAFLTNVAEYVGPSARYIHRGLTSSDILDTSLAVQMVQAIDILIRDVKAVRAAVAVKARKYKFTPMMGRSHGVHAEPITFGLKMALMHDEFGRALARLQAARQTIAVGQLSGAVGTHAHLDPFVEKYVCRKLGLKPAAISTQILQRDRHAHYITALALVGASVDRWATEFRHLQRTEVHEMEEFFGSEQKGSSAMPHKKNPITGEKLSGLSRLLRGNMVAAMENVALWHERDISHSSVERIIVPDSTIALDHMLRQLDRLVTNMKVYPKRMMQNLNMTHGLVHSQQVLLMLTDKGFSRETAYRMVQRHAMESWETGTEFRKLIEADPEIMHKIKPKDLNRVFDLNVHFKDVNRTFKAVGL